MTASRPVVGGTVVLDSQGLALWVRRDRRLTALLHAADRRGRRVVTSAATLVEVIHPKLNRAALSWALSRLVIVPVTVDIARQAADLLGDTGRHGHRHAIDAMVCATALDAESPAVVLTSDADGITALCGDRVAVVAI
ncbi:MAG: type II toxin-antitoxin system VapC family toxin [Dermatophilaceae bacterium]